MLALPGLISGRGLPITLAGSIALAALLAAGCNQGSEAKPLAEPRKPPATPAEVLLDRVVEAYHQANRYQDAGRLLVKYTQDGNVVSESSEFSLSVVGPNRIRMRAYDALVVCDGQTFRATIDEAPGEVLSFPAPEELSPASIYGDQVLGKAFNKIVGSVPLALFLDPEPLPALLANARTPKLDPPKKIGDRNCYRLRLERREGPMVLWIDDQTFVVLRVDYPTGGYRRLLESHLGPISDMTITADLATARLDPPIGDDTFRFEMPKGAELVKRFDAVRPGARIPKFKLHSLDGRLITRDSLADKIAVIKFWQADDVLSYHHDLSAFEQVQRRYQDQDSVVFLAVSADPEEVTDRDLQTALSQAELSLPIARVALQVATRSFGLQQLPTTVILGRDGTLQEQVPGVYPNQTTVLPKQIDTLLAGGDLTLEAPQKPLDFSFYSGFNWQNDESADPVEPPAIAALAKTGIAPPSEPELLRRKRLWTCSDLRQPGNLLVVHDDAMRDRVFAIEGLPSVAEIGAAGKVLAKHRLELPDRDDASIAFLRTATDGAGNRHFLGSQTGVQQLHVFDAGWKRLLSYPESGRHPGIADAILADLDGDGELEMLVGYVEEVGVHGVTLDGQRLWRNRTAENVLGLALTGPDRRGQRQLLVADGPDGVVLPIDSEGNDRPPIVLSDAFVLRIFTADLNGDDALEWCVIALKWLGPNELGPALAVGLSSRGEELWRYPLPSGTHQHAEFEMVAAGDLLGGQVGQWIIAAADASIHILGIDGRLFDHFNYGVAPSGMAVANLDGPPALLISGNGVLEAWQFEMPRQDEQDETDLQ